MALDDLVHDRQPKSGAFADRLGGEEGVENLRQYVVGNATAGVFEADLDKTRLGDRPDSQRTLVAHRLCRIGDHVQEYLVDLRGHAFHLWHVAEFFNNGDAVA